MAILGKGIIQLVADASKATQEIKNVKGQADKIASALGKTGAVMTASVTTPIMGAFTMAIGAASDLNEAANKLEVTFGQYGDTVKNALGDTVQNFGMARDAAYEAAATYGIFLKAAGLTEQQMAQMSPKLVQVAADMASFHNLDVDEALYKVRAALSGETEPLKAVGILMNDTLVKAQALQMGLVSAQVDMIKVQQITLRLKDAQEKYNEAVKEYGPNSEQAQEALLRVQELEQKLQKAMQGKMPQLTEAQKIQARYALLMEQSAVFAGDFARTQTGVANSSRMLQEALHDLAAEFGTELLPLAQNFLQEALKMIKFFKSLPEPVKQNIIRFMALAAAIGPLLMGLSGIIKVGQGIGTVIGLISKVGSLAGIVQSASAAIMTALGPIGWIVLAIVAAIGLLYIAWTNNWGGIQEKTAAAVAWIKTQLTAAWTTLKQLVFLAGYYLDQFKQWIDTKLNEAAQTIATWVGLVPTYWQMLINTARIKWLEFLNLIATIGERIKQLAIQKFQSMVNRIRAVFSIDWGALGRKIVSGIIGGIGSMAGALVSKMKGLAQSALSAAKSVLGIHSPSRVFEEFGRQSIEGYIRGLDVPPLGRALERTFAPATVQTGADANATGQPVVQNITIYNPQPQAAEDSIARTLKRLAFLGHA